MQACEVCGWDTRAGTRVCASCRAGLESGDIGGDSVLAGVLQQAHDMSVGDAGHPPDDGAGATTSRRPRGSRQDDDGREQVVLREIEPGGDERERSHRAEPSSVAASLIEAFQSPRDTRTTADASTAPDRLKAGAAEDLPAADADEVGEDASAASVDRPPPTHPVEPMADTDHLDALASPRSGDQDVIGEGAPEAAEVAASAPTTTPPHARADEASPPWTSPDDSGPITDRFANIPTVPMDSGPSPHLSANASADTADAAPGPPAAHGGTSPSPVRADGQTTAQTPTDARAGSPTTTTTTASQDTSDTPAWRAALREAGTWTAVAQFTLLFIGMLCVFQVVVLLVVNQFLSQAQTQQAVAADMLTAHAKVTTVMLPAVVGGAFAAAAFAAWRAHTDPQQHDDTAPLRRWVLGLPVAIWAVIVTATVLLLVVVLGTSATVAGAQRTTLWAIGACTLLGVACVAAPRGLAAVEDDPDVGEAPWANST